MFEEINWTILDTYAMQCFYLEYSEIGDIRATDIVKTTGVYIETHTTCTHAFLMPLMRVSLCNDLSCYSVESLRTEIHPRQPSTAWMRLPAAVDHVTKKYSFLHFWSHIKDQGKRIKDKKKEVFISGAENWLYQLCDVELYYISLYLLCYRLNLTLY